MSPPKRFPALPKSITAPGGAVTVRRVVGIKLAGGGEAWGTWEPHTRTIEIDKTAPMAHQWRVLFHELAHVALDDAGLHNGMNEELIEACCDAMATARFRERFG